MNYDWINNYLAMPFEVNSYGPNSFDCFGLVWHINKYHNNLELPRFDDIGYQLDRINAEISNQTLSEDWLEVDSPLDFDCVVMRRADEAYHVGVWLNVDGGKVLHAMQKGILCTDLGCLRRMGYQHISYHRFVYANH